MKIKYIIGRLLVRSQKYTGLDNIYFLKNTWLSFIQQSIGLLSGLTISYMFGHFASKLLFGQYNLILSVISLLTILTLPGLDNALIRSVASGFDKSLKQAVKIKILWSFFGIPVLIGFAIYYLILQDQKEIAFVFLLTTLFFPLLSSFSLFSEFLTAKRKFKSLTFYLSLSSVFTAILVSFAIFFTKSLIIIILGYFVGTILPSILGYHHSLKYTKNERYDPELFSYGLFLTGLSILPWLSGYLGQILLASFLGFESLAIFAAASRFPMSIQKNIFVFYKPITAKLASQTKEEHIQTLKKHWWKLSLWGISLCLFLWIVIPFLINFFFTNKYSESIKYAQFLSLSIIPLPLWWVISDILLYQRRKTSQLILATVPHIVKLGLFVVLIPTFGIAGLVFSVVFDRFFLLFAGLSVLKLVRK